MKAPLNLCLLFGLISPVVLLKCKMCSNPSGTTCPKAIDGNCTSDFSCRNYIFDSNVLLNMSIAIKSCTPSERCDPGYYSLTTSGGGFIKMLVDCCTTYNCNSRDLEFSSEPMEPNGLQCEGCHVKDRGMCKGAEMVKCLGDQTKCISMKIMSYMALLLCEACLSLKRIACFYSFPEFCRPNSSCINYIIDTNVFRDFIETKKSCTPTASCEPGHYSFTTTGGKFIKMLVECCRTKKCNSESLDFALESMEPNGLECEGPCDKVETVKCLGDQTKCISMNITYMADVSMKHRVFTTKGCATPLMCDQSKVQNNLNFGYLGVTDITANCTDAVLSPEPSSLA